MAEEMTESEENIVFVFILSTRFDNRYKNEQRNKLCNVKNDFLIILIPFTPLLPHCLYSTVLYCTVLYCTVQAPGLCRLFVPPSESQISVPGRTDSR